MSVIILDGIAEVVEDYAGIIYSVDDNSEAMLHKIGDWSSVEQLWHANAQRYKSIENLLCNLGEKFYLLKVTASDPALPDLHNASRLEQYLIQHNVHPLQRQQRLRRVK